MEFDIENLPKSHEELANIILHLRQSLHQNQSELAEYKVKYANLIEEIRLAKQRFFAPSSEKDILQPDIFDEAGVELSEEVKEQLEDEEIQIPSHLRKKHSYYYYQETSIELLKIHADSCQLVLPSLIELIYFT